MTQQKPQKSEKASSASEAPKKNSLEQKVEKTSTSRDDVTRSLTSGLITPTRTVDKLVADACKFAGIVPPKPGEALAPFVYKLQKQVCKFSKVDTKNGCDGMLGPITFSALLKKLPKLKIYSKEARTAGTKRKIRELARKSGLPKPPEKPSPQEAAPEAKETAITPAKTAILGDSLSKQYAKYFYKGTSKYRESVNKNFGVGWNIQKIRQQAEKNLPMAEAYVINGGINAITGFSVDRMAKEYEKIIALIKAKNPNVKKIVLLTVHGENYKYYKNKRRQVNPKIRGLNDRLIALAAADPKIKLVDINAKIKQAEAEGHRMTSRSDNLHFNARGQKAVAGLIKDELQTGEQGVLTDYA